MVVEKHQRTLIVSIVSHHKLVLTIVSKIMRDIRIVAWWSSIKNVEWRYSTSYSWIHNSDIDTSFPPIIKDTGNHGVCVTRNFWLKHFKKLGKIVTWFADKGFWQYSTTPSNKFTLSLLTFRNLLEILWSCRSTFYKERYVYNYNSLVSSLRTFKRSSFECMGNLAFLVEISKPLTIFGIRKL